MAEKTKITFLGTNCLLFSKAGSSLLIDPHFIRPRLAKLMGRIAPDPGRISENLAKARVESLDGVLLTHTHYDHALDAVEVTKQTGAFLYGSSSAMMLAGGEGLDSIKGQEVSNGEKVKVGKFRIRFIHSRHIQFPAPFRWFMSDDELINQPLAPPAWFWQYRCGQVFAILVDRTLVFGSANFIPGAYSDQDVDTVILGIGGLGMKPRGYLENLYGETVLSSGAKKVLVSHWDNFFRPVGEGLRPLIGSLRTFGQLVQLGHQYGQEVELLRFGVPMTIQD